MNAEHNESVLLRTALLANCVFSGLSGIILLFGSNRLSGLFGLHMPTILIGVGLLFVGSLSTVGNWTVTIAANIVLLFAVLQFYAIRRLRREGAVCELR